MNLQSPRRDSDKDKNRDREFKNYCNRIYVIKKRHMQNN